MFPNMNYRCVPIKNGGVGEPMNHINTIISNLTGVVEDDLGIEGKRPPWWGRSWSKR